MVIIQPMQAYLALDVLLFIKKLKLQIIVYLILNSLLEESPFLLSVIYSSPKKK